MFKAECEKIVKYDLRVSEDIVKFCQWVLDVEQDDAFGDNSSTIDFLDEIANKAPQFTNRNSEINIEYHK